jgi:LuxR family maltose regulon positive regulatory protein
VEGAAPFFSDAQDVPLLKTKLYIPPVRPGLVSRPRLVEQLDQSIRSGCKLTLISAPAGFGKTTLLSEWVCHLGLCCAEPRLGTTDTPTPQNRQSTIVNRVAWLSLDEGDNDPTRFLTYVIAALQTVEDSMGQGLLPALQSPSPVNVEAVLTTLLNEIAGRRRHLVLVLDDYHAIESQAIDRAITFLLDHLPPHANLVIASRTDPALALSRLRGRGQLTELREAELRFTPDEVTAFFERVIRLPVSTDDLRTLTDRTEGWITGLQLAAMAMQSLEQGEQMARFVRSFGGSHRYVIDYLVDEVLDRQTPQIQAFLLQTSILKRMTASLCNAVTGREDSQAVLEGLEAANLFLIPLDGERRWYRYHHLFADLLIGRLRQAQPGQVPTLHSRASEWYAHHGFQAEAVHHALAGGDAARAADLIEANGLRLIGQGAFSTVQNWIDVLPEGLVRERPYLCVYYAWASNFTHQLQAIEPYLKDAERTLEAQGLPADDAVSRDLRGHMATLRAWNARRQRDNALAIALLTEAVDWLGNRSPFVRAFANLNLGLAYLDGGDLVKAADSLRDAMSQPSASENELVSIMAASHLAAVLILQGQLHEAANLCRRTIREQLGQHGKPPPTLCLTYLRLGWVLAEWNDVDGYFDHLSQGIILADQIGFDSVVTAGSMSMAWEKQLLAKQGTDIAFSEKVAEIIDRALAVATDASETQHSPQGDTDLPAIESQNIEVYLADDSYFEIWPGYSGIARARKLAEEGRTEEALALLGQICESARAVEGIGLMIEAWTSEALVHQSQHNLDYALEALKDALSLSEPRGYVRTYVDRDEPMAQLLRQAAARGIMPDYTAKLLAAFGPEKAETAASPPAQPPVEPLSKRELEILGLIAQGLSNRQIGERLFLALSTVKGHNQNLFGKLGVKRRTEAVAHARALGLL